MENENLTRKQIIPMIVGVLTLVVLVASATYAYFSVTAGNTSGTTTITGDIGGDTIGSVTLAGGNTNLYLGVSADDMSETNKGKVYYSSTTEGSRETNVNSAGKTTYTATLSGDETDSVMYACDYEFTVTSSGTALGKEATSDIELVFNGDINKTINLTGSDKVSGTWYGFKNSNKERAFNAYLQLKNTEEEQNDIAGTNLSVSISNTKWKCYLSELDELVGDAYALKVIETETSCSEYTNLEGKDVKECETTEIGNPQLIFLRSEMPFKVGDTYNDKSITTVYTGFETSHYQSKQDVPWLNNDFDSIIFEDEIRPISTAYWFSDLKEDEDLIIENLAVLNTSLVTNMSHMFSYTSFSSDLSTFDTSNVTDMSYMFASEGVTRFPSPRGIENWDTSKVTNMSHMFSTTIISVNLSNWDVSNVCHGCLQEMKIVYFLLLLEELKIGMFLM